VANVLSTTGASGANVFACNGTSTTTGVSGTGAGVQAQNANVSNAASGTGCYNSAAATSISIIASGGGAAHNNMQPFAVLLKIIKR
jgi:microcystin-dependent protein